ncbi:MAG TPA: PspA/IM30 family protein [Bryobacteraceae bacterium]|jgi:phage shock protein A|nr:PspA/IM30 family protein [Bryobacteraceae bacterium]
MALLERVGTLLRANLNDLIDRAEDPEKMVKQVILDMENQLMQVKTQVAISIADLHLLEKKREETDRERDSYVRTAGLAVEKQKDDVARQALERSLDAKKRIESFDQQIADQKVQVENLKEALRKLNGKLADARAKSDVLIAQHHRARAAGKAAEAHMNVDANAASSAWDRLKHKVNREEAIGKARADLLGDDVESQFAALEKQDEIERLLAELKRPKG